MTDGEAEYYLRHLPVIEARRHYSMAQLTADFREMFFTRFLDPDPNPPSSPPRRRDPWRVEDVLPPFAQLTPDGGEPRIPEAALAALRAAYERLPSWAQAQAKHLI